ncbi:MAG: hypothetical protein M1819_005782 [Sarea resinae]|nr:MAG: hypothetical protein M1819_005782 [Sarea resinae]
MAKRGGNLHQTKLRKIDGDIKVLRNELQKALAVEDKDIAINQLTRHIIIKGWRKPEVTKFLEQKHF